jgi:hypothetical protein
MAEIRYTYKILVGKPEGNKPFQKPRHRWKDKIKIDLKELDKTEWTGFTWLMIGTGVGSTEHSNEPWGSTKGWKLN